jgi:hypothetical protein
MPPDCTAQLEICIAIDGSASVSNDDFQAEKDYLKNLADGLNIAQDGVRTYLWDFASLVTPQWSWTTVPPPPDPNKNNEAFKNAVQAIVKNVGITLLADALNLCTNTSFTDPELRPNAAKVAVVITDGRDNSVQDLGAAAADLAAVAVDGVYVIGVGNEDLAAFDIIASHPDNIFHVPDWGDLANALEAKKLASQFCTPGEKECSCCCPEPKYIFPFSS